MYICVCKGITDTDIAQAVQDGHDSIKKISRQTGLGTCCGGCIADAKILIQDTAMTEAKRNKLAELAYVA